MNAINIQLEPVVFKMQNRSGAKAGELVMLPGKNNRYSVITIANDIAEASGFIPGDRANLLAMKDGSMFQIVASNSGLITFKKKSAQGGIRINSQPMCAEILSRVMRGYGKEIIRYKARVPEPGIINFYPEE